MTTIRRNNTPRAFKPVNGPGTAPAAGSASSAGKAPGAAEARPEVARRPASAATVAGAREVAAADRGLATRLRDRLEAGAPSSTAALDLLKMGAGGKRPWPGATPDIGGPTKRPADAAMGQAWDRAKPIVGPLARGAGDQAFEWFRWPWDNGPKPAGPAQPGTPAPAPSRNEREAITRGEELLHGAGTDKASGVPEADVIRDPGEANGESAELQARARQEVEANAALEQQKLSTLSATERAKYEDLAKVCEDDPASRLSLQMMLFDGRLPGSTKSAGGGTLLEELHKTATEPVVEGIDRDSLVSDMVQEIYDPASISQKGKGTCAATSAMIAVARDDPAEYARLVRGLASPEGRVTMRNGDSIGREEGTASEDGSRRTQSERLLSATLMEYGKKWLGYSNDSDTHFGGGRGLSVDDTNRILEGMTGRDWNARSAGNDEAAGRLADEMDAALDAGGPVLAGLDWGANDSGIVHGRHKVMVTDMTDSTVTYVNPWGQVETMPRAEFEQRLNNANIPS